MAWVLGLSFTGLWASAAWAFSNNGFETDWVYAIKTSDASLVAMRERDGEVTATLLPPLDLKDPKNTDWVSLTFAGTAANNDARLFVAQAFPRQVGQIQQHATDVRIIEIDARGKVLQSATLTSLLPGTPSQVGPYTRLANIRFSSYHGTLLVSVDHHYRDDESRIQVYEIDLGLRRILNTYVGAKVHNDEANMDVSPIDGTLYLCEPNMGQPPNKELPRTGQGDLIAIDTSGGSTTAFVTLIDGPAWRMKNPRWLNPGCPIWRGPGNPTGRPTLLVLLHGQGVAPWPQLEFYLDGRDDTELPKANLALRGALYTAERFAWRGQLDEMTDTVMATRLNQKDELAGIDLIAPDDTARRIGQSNGWQDVDSPGMMIRPPRARPAAMPRIDPQDPRRFIMDGRPWYPAGDYPRLSTMTVQAPGRSLPAYYRTLHQKLAASGLNYYRTVFTFGQPFVEHATQTLPYVRTDVAGAADGGNKFDLDKFNDAHFRYWRGLIQDARVRGIVVQLCIMDSWHNKHFKTKPKQWDLKYDFYAGANNVNGVDAPTEDAWHSTDPASPVWKRHVALIERVVDWLGDQPNLVWEISNEPKPYYDGTDKPETGKIPNDWATRLGRHLKEYERSTRGDGHLCLGVDLPDHQHTAGQRPDWYQTPEIEKDGHTPTGARRDLLGQFHKSSQPLISDNDAGGSGLNADGRRQKAWAALTAGAHMDYFHFEMADVDSVSSTNVAEGMRYIGYVPKFLRECSVDLRGMVPSDNLVSSGWCLARAGDEYVIYLIAGGATAISDLPPHYRAAWFDPRDGIARTAEGGPSFTAPDGKDWVLHIRRTESASRPASTREKH